MPRLLSDMPPLICWTTLTFPRDCMVLQNSHYVTPSNTFKRAPHFVQFQLGGSVTLRKHLTVINHSNGLIWAQNEQFILCLL